MLLGFDTEFAFRSMRLTNGRAEPDVTTARPVCACLAFADGREMKFVDGWKRLGEVVNDERHTVVVHGAHAERFFCKMVGIPFPASHVDTQGGGTMNP